MMPRGVVTGEEDQGAHITSSSYKTPIFIEWRGDGVKFYSIKLELLREMENIRSIPNHPKGYKNEWGAMLQRQDELHKQLEKEEMAYDKQKQRKHKLELDEQLKHQRHVKNLGAQAQERLNREERVQIQKQIDEKLQKEQNEQSKKRAAALAVENDNKAM